MRLTTYFQGTLAMESNKDISDIKSPRNSFSIISSTFTFCYYVSMGIQQHLLVWSLRATIVKIMPFFFKYYINFGNNLAHYEEKIAT